MEKDGRQSGGPEQVAGSREPERASPPAPGKVTRTTRLSPGRGPAIQRAAIVAATTHDSAEVRYMAGEAGAALGCLDNAALARLAKSDPDADVRARAQALATARP